MQAYMIEDILHLKVSLSSVLTVSNGWGWGSAWHDTRTGKSATRCLESLRLRGEKGSSLVMSIYMCVYVHQQATSQPSKIDK
jgi:hypothetical protein